MKKYFAEFIGTFILVFVGCGSVVFAGEHIGQIGIAAAFGLTLSVIAYALGPISGAHVNPAVSAGVLLSGRMSFKDFIGYSVFQFAGAFVAAYILLVMTYGKMSGYDVSVLGLGQNGWGENYGGGYNLLSAVIFEFIAVFLFVRIILEVTKTENSHAGFVIGLTLMLMIALGMQITGGSLNPARSFGPAVFVKGQALDQLWMFVTVPLAAGILAGLGARFCPCRDMK